MALRVALKEIQRVKGELKIRKVVAEEDGKHALLFLPSSEPPDSLPEGSFWVEHVRLAQVDKDTQCFEGGHSEDEELAAFTYSELFCGIGGFSVALRELGGRCMFACEIDHLAREVCHRNFGFQPAGNIYDHNVPPELKGHTMLTAGFPCQSFTIASKDARGLSDPRGQLFFELVRFVRESSPKCFLLENVPNLLQLKDDLQVILSALRELGYIVEYSVINSSSVVPQKRRRLWFVGFRDQQASEKFEWPSFDGPPLPAGDVLEENVGDEYLLTEAHIRQLLKHNDSVSERILNPAEPSRTIVSGYLSTGRNTQMVGPAERPRFFTEREVARLQGFPDTFNIEQQKHPRRFYHQCGNAVPPPVVKLIAQQMLKALGI